MSNIPRIFPISFYDFFRWTAMAGQLYYRNSEEFSEKFVWYRSEDDCEDELED